MQGKPCCSRPCDKTPETQRMGFGGKRQLFPLNGSAGLGRQVKEDPVDSLHLCGDSGGEVLQQGEGDVLYGSGHGVHRVDGPDNHRPVKGTGVVPDAGGLEVGDHREVLPDFPLQAVLGELLPEDSVRLPHGLQPIPGDGAQAAHAQAGAGEGLAVHHAVRQAQGRAVAAAFGHELGADPVSDEALEALLTASDGEA